MGGCRSGAKGWREGGIWDDLIRVSNMKVFSESNNPFKFYGFDKDLNPK